MRHFRDIMELLTLLACLAGCINIERPVILEEEGGGTEEAEPIIIVDTVVLMCGAEYPPEYDWMRDTAYGRVSPDIVLFKNGERTLTLHTGGSSGLSSLPDMHYLMDDGHLYSQGQRKGHTVVFRDGMEHISYQGEELIRGLAIVDGDVYTLGQDRSGEGFSYRKNGKQILSRKSGHIVGQMNSNPHYRSGALYSDSGQLHFAYWEAGDPGQYLWTLVTDGVENRLQLKCSPSELFDLRVIGGDVYRLMSTPQTRSCVLITGATEIDVSSKAAKLCTLGPGGENGVIVTGQTQYSDGSSSSFIWSHAKGLQPAVGSSYYFVCDEGICEMSFRWEGSFLISQPGDKRVLIYRGEVFFPSFRNGVTAGRQLFLAINPEESGKKPCSWTNGENHEVDLNGYLTGIQVQMIESVLPDEGP